MNSINPVINGFPAETNNLYGPTNDREIAHCPFIRIYNGMNMAVVAIVCSIQSGENLKLGSNRIMQVN